uniref:Uncharacterized protein n=1 Tax=Panagrellus redivivus TaxID=6233 RepID=A0A7E4VF00_PANRE
MAKGDEKTISFTGAILHLHIENPKKTKNKSLLDHKPVSTYQINRRGDLVQSDDRINGGVVFNVDGSVTLKVAELPYGCIVKLLNAVEVIPTTTTITQTPTTVTVSTAKTSNNIVYYVIGGLALLLMLFVGASIAWICWARKPETKKAAGAVPLNESDNNHISRRTSTSTRKRSVNQTTKAVKNGSQPSRSTVKTQKHSGIPSNSAMKPTKSSVIQPLSIHSSSEYGNHTEASEK